MHAKWIEIIEHSYFSLIQNNLSKMWNVVKYGKIGTFHQKWLPFTTEKIF